MYRVLVSSTFQKEYGHLDPESQSRIRNALEQLAEDPFTSRTHVDINALKDTEPKKYRLRIGQFRVVYAVFENEIRVIELFSRKRGYRL